MREGNDSVLTHLSSVRGLFIATAGITNVKKVSRAKTTTLRTGPRERVLLAGVVGVAALVDIDVTLVSALSRVCINLYVLLIGIITRTHL